MVDRKKRRELLGLPFLLLVIIFPSIFATRASAQIPFFSLLLGKDPIPAGSFQVPADSGTQRILAGFDGAPLYYEWSDSALFHRDYRAEGYLRYQSMHDPWNLWVEYRYRTFDFTVHPVDYQELRTRLTRSAARVFLRRRLPFHITPAVMLSYDQASRQGNYHLSLRWSRYPWFRPEITYGVSTVAHHTIFRLFQTDLQFQDLYRTRNASMGITSSKSAPSGYAVTYSTGTIGQPTGIRSQEESQQTELAFTRWHGALWLSLPGGVTLKPEFTSCRYRGDSFWYSSGVRFADINKIHLTNRLFSLEVKWRKLGYSYSRETLQYDLYGQVRGFPFTEAAIDLLGSEFVVSSQGTADIGSHRLSLRLGRQTQPSLIITTAYHQVDLPTFDYRTYALILGFPRRETLRVTRTNLQSADLLRIAVHAKVSVAPHLSFNPSLQQFIPVHIEYITEPQPGGGYPPGKKRHVFGGLRFSIELSYRI